MPLTPDNWKPRSTRWTYLVGLGLLGLTGCVPEDAGFEVDPMTGGQSHSQEQSRPAPTQFRWLTITANSPH